jgi:hypothetical protein
MPLRIIFEAASVADLSSEIERLLVAKIEAMSEMEVQRLLDSTPRGLSDIPVERNDCIQLRS